MTYPTARSARDKALDTASIGMELVPAVGGFLAGLIDQIKRDREEAQANFINELADKLSELGSRLDADFVQTADFQAMAEEVIEKAARRKELDKIEYYAQALARTATAERPREADRYRMIDTLERLRPSHLRLLAIIFETRSNPPELANILSGGTDLLWPHLMPGVDLDAIKLDWADLAQLGLVQGYPTGTMTANSIGNLRARLTPFGERFVSFISPLPENAP